MLNAVFELRGGRTLTVPEGRPVDTGEVMRAQIIEYITMRAATARRHGVEDAVAFEALAGDLRARLDEADEPAVAA